MSTSPQTTGQRLIYVHLDQEPEVTQEVRISLFDYFGGDLKAFLLAAGFCNR